LPSQREEEEIRGGKERKDPPEVEREKEEDAGDVRKSQTGDPQEKKKTPRKKIKFLRGN